MVGNGNIALTADIAGLATFPSAYSSRVPLMIQAQWAWHSFPNPKHYRLEDSLVPVDIGGQSRAYPWLRDWEEAKQPHIDWLRKNPHRFSLGRLALLLVSRDGGTAKLEQLGDPLQELDLWTGRLSSNFTFEGEPVHVETSVHPVLDAIVVRLRSRLVASRRLGLSASFPGVAQQLEPDPADWDHPAAHRTQVLSSAPRALSLERSIDDTRYYVKVASDQAFDLRRPGPHRFELLREPAEGRAAGEISFIVAFSPRPLTSELPAPSAARAAVERHWQRHWSRGGVVDFAGSTDPRAAELERRVVLSQYLLAVNSAGSLPPQEEGLFSNSWSGKFHLEMHPWHAAHFATWGRSELLERSLGWYLGHLPRARQRARANGARGAWWPKMVGPVGRESPSTINPMIMWQQPHPIYLSELVYRAHRGRATLDKYRELVFQTAELLASYPRYDAARQRHVLGPPIVPAQEVFSPLDTFNPTFELAYFRFGLELAQEWRERLGLARQPRWDEVLRALSPLPQKDGLYLAAESHPSFWRDARSRRCSRDATDRVCLNRDHPSFLAAYGLLPGRDVDPATMSRTLDAVLEHWDLRHIWGWDLPMMAMTAARLHEPERAVQLLLQASKNFAFGAAGMTPRVHYDAAALTTASDNPDGPGYRRAAETYFPSNGALLLAVGMMAAGWDGAGAEHPGFPREGWVVRHEGLLPLP